jgi:carboxymethylenebutenolidase
MGEQITIATDNGAFAAYLARPAAKPAPSVVVLHEVFGVNADLRQTCDDLASQGFFAVCPDLFWRQEPGVDLGVKSDVDWQHGLALYGAYDRDLGVLDVVETLKVAARLDGASGRVAVMGYCLGGLMTFLTAARAQVDAAVAFHGADTEKYLDEVGGIRAPLLMHLAGEDEFMPEEARNAIRAAIAGKPNAQVLNYAGCHHAFSRHGGAHYDAAAAARANAATLTFLRNWLDD